MRLVVRKGAGAALLSLRLAADKAGTKRDRVQRDRRAWEMAKWPQKAMVLANCGSVAPALKCTAVICACGKGQITYAVEEMRQ